MLLRSQSDPSFLQPSPKSHQVPCWSWSHLVNSTSRLHREPPRDRLLKEPIARAAGQLGTVEGREGFGCQEATQPAERHPGILLSTHSRNQTFFLQRWSYAELPRGKDWGSVSQKGTAEPPQGGCGTHRFEGSDFSQQTLINLVMFFSLTICNSYILHFLSEQKGHLVPIGVTSIYIYRLCP